MRSYLFASVILIAPFTALGCGHSENPEDTLPQADRTPAPPQEQAKRAIQGEGHNKGVIAAVNEDRFHLALGWRGKSDVDRGGYEDNTKPKLIRTTGTAPGGALAGKGRRLTHLISDLQVGDAVTLRTFKTEDGAEWSWEISITRRPGGQIPPQSGDPFVGSEHAFHLQNQAEQDWEEHGVPIPAKYLDPHGRAPWTNPPYPPVAPEPRAAPAKP